MKKTKAKELEGKLLTETELELMTILWKLDEGSVSDVMERLAKERNLAYTSVSTILRILEQKGILKTRKEGRGHIYTPQIMKSEYEAKTVKHVVDRVFDGTPVALVRQLLDTVKLNEDDLEELRKLIDQAGGRK
jgi:predicted transcriptional regulator